jgi:ectoine hydroxylase-related dioxygenase (phytanoyl-CoA dioxygenase family)
MSFWKTMHSGPFSADELAAYQRDGYLLLRQLFDRDEIELLREAAKRDRALDEQAYGRNDGEGGSVRLSLWNHPGDDLYGMFSRNARVVDRVEQLLGDEPYHYHSKMIMKEARTGGAWAWHQDYGYWYENGVLFPNLCSVFIAVDPATRANGCLQVLRGSHAMGRITHVKTGDQTGADPERVAAAAERLELVYVEMAPGDALFFHPNLLHRSDQNHSPHDRWALVCCYNARSNDPYKEGRHPRYTPLTRVEAEAIRKRKIATS